MQLSREALDSVMKSIKELPELTTGEEEAILEEIRQDQEAIEETLTLVAADPWVFE